MNRKTLEDTISERLGIEVYQFARSIGIRRSTLNDWNNHNRLLLSIVISGYEREVLRK